MAERTTTPAGRTRQARAPRPRPHRRDRGEDIYWQQGTYDFAFVYVPGETASTRARARPRAALLETRVEARVLPASPTTLQRSSGDRRRLAGQETVAENAREVIADLGRELYDRLRRLLRSTSQGRPALDTAVGAYNEAVDSLETRLDSSPTASSSRRRHEAPATTHRIEPSTPPQRASSRQSAAATRVELLRATDAA